MTKKDFKRYWRSKYGTPKVPWSTLFTLYALHIEFSKRQRRPLWFWEV